jgi:hypothetical protein
MLKAKGNEINEQGKEKQPANEMNEINEHVEGPIRQNTEGE